MMRFLDDLKAGIVGLIPDEKLGRAWTAFVAQGRGTHRGRRVGFDPKSPFFPSSSTNLAILKSDSVSVHHLLPIPLSVE